MDTDHKNYGKGPRELTGAVDLVSYYKLFPHHDFFCKRPLPLSISETQYLYNVVGDAAIRKGEGMQFDQLIRSGSSSQETGMRFRPFELDVLGEAFQLRDTNPVDLPTSEKGIPTVSAKSKSELKDKEKKHKKHKDREHKKHKHHHKDQMKDKDNEKKKDKNDHHGSGKDRSQRHHEKKRKQDDEDGNDIQKHKKSKQKISKMDDKGTIR